MQKRLKEIKPGEIFKFGGYEWIKLEEEGLALTKEVIVNKAFDDTNTNIFDLSSIKIYLRCVFCEKLKENGADMSDIKHIELDYTADDGTRCNCDSYFTLMGLLTADLYRKNRHLLKPIEACWWLATPTSYSSSHTDSVLSVDSDGLLCDEYANYESNGIRPLCKLSDDTLVEVPGEGKTQENEEIEDITELIKKWATERDLMFGKPTAQMVKLMEEVGELANGINKDREGQIIDSIGDIYVVLVILCMQLDLDINGCIKAAYEKIKNRKGKLVDGLFVEEENLE